MNFTTLKIDIRDEIVFCSLNRPEKRNALNESLLRDLKTLCISLEERQDIRGLVLQGTGKVFSAGADLSMMSDISGKTKNELKKEAGLFYDCFESLYRLSIPTICYARGGVHGGANGLLSACDFALCDPGTSFSFAEVKLGLVPATVAPFVVRRTGIMNARKLMIGGETISGAEAHSYGLIDILCKEAEAEKVIMDLLGQILGNSPKAVRWTKKLLLDIEDSPDHSGLKELCAGLIAEIRLSEDAREGISAFFEKRNPLWKSKIS